MFLTTIIYIFASELQLWNEKRIFTLNNKAPITMKNHVICNLSYPTKKFHLYLKLVAKDNF
jgi:hypothetical protein